MKSVSKCLGFFLAVVLSVDSFSQGNSNTYDQHLMAHQNPRVEVSTDTPLYPNTKPWIVDSIELNYSKAARRLALLFPDAIKLRWIKEDNALFAYFFSRNRKVYAVFTLQGRMNYAITYMEPSDLPFAIAKKIGDDYEQYSVFNVKQVLICGYTVYRIILENEYEYIHVQISDTDTEEVERLKKSVSNKERNADK